MLCKQYEVDERHKVVLNGIENAVLFVGMHGVRAPAREGVYE